VNKTAPSAPPADPDDIELIDFHQLRNWIGFVFHSVSRHKLLALLTFLMGAIATVTVAMVLPRTYHVETQLLAQRNSLMGVLGNPGRGIPADADAPTRAAAETVLRRDNVVSLMKQTDLMKLWDQQRPPAMRQKDQIFRILFGPPTDEDRLNGMIGFLEKQLVVTTAESTITIAIDWPDAQQAYRLVDVAQQNFLEQRHSAEVSTIAETITILEGHASNLREAIDSALEDVKRRQEVHPGRSFAGAPVQPKRDPVREALKAEAAELKVMLDAKRRAVNELEGFRSRRLADLQTELVQARAVYADAHPVVIKIQSSIAALQQDSPQLAALRKDERELATDYAKRAGLVQQSAAASASARADPDPGRGAPLLPAGSADNEYARTQLRFALEKYDALMERIDSARIELDTTRAAFKYRYGVIRPAMLPKQPTKPRVPLILALGMMVSVALTFMVTTLADVRSGRILEQWEVKRFLGLPVLGEVSRP
jgi:hypothetical protein